VSGLSAKKQWLKWASVFVLLITAIYLIKAVDQHWADIPKIQWTPSAWLALASTVVLVLCNLMLGSLMWKALLKDQGFDLPILTSLQIVGMSQVGKYLPGNIGHVVGQVGLAKEAGVPVGVSLAAMLVSTLWLVATGLAVGGSGLLIFFDVQKWLQLHVPHPIWLLALSILIMVSPWIGLWSINRFLPNLSIWLGQGQAVRLPTFVTALLVASGFVACFFVFGLMLKLQALYLFGITNGNILTFTLLFTSAWVAGYLLPGAPGGLGVREAITIALFSPLVGPGAAVGLSVTMRLVTVLGDGLAFLVGLLFRWLQTSRHP
jgi:uncharacterized membrane protein YbhN (UPF0104 family)